VSIKGSLPRQIHRQRLQSAILQTNAQQETDIARSGEYRSDNVQLTAVDTVKYTNSQLIFTQF